MSGKLDIIDADKGEAVFQVQSNVEDGNYGRFSIDANGNWSYTLNNAHPDVQSLKAGETLTRELTVTSADGSDSHKVVITIVGANEAPVAQDFMIKPLSDHGVLINFNNPGGDGGDKISDEEDDAANGGNADLKVIITDLPEAGILIYTDLNGVSRAITQADVSKTPFEADRISYQPTDGLGFLLGSKSEPDHSLKDGGFLNWGNQIDAEGKVREVKLANGGVITISSDSGPLTQYQNNASHVGHGIGDNDGYGIESGEHISINFSSEPAYEIEIGLDGLGGLFEDHDPGAALITVTYSDGKTEQFEIRKPGDKFGDDGLFQKLVLTAPGDLTITQLTFSTKGDGNWELRYVESSPKNETFKYQTIDSERVLSNEATVIVNNSNGDRTPVAQDGHIVTNEDQSYVFKWSDFGVTDVDTLPSALSVIIDSLPLDGSLTLNGTAIVAGTSVNYEDIEAGKLMFKPDTRESSTNNSSQDGAVVGNKESDYAKFDFRVSDGVSISKEYAVVIDVTPDANMPKVSIAIGQGVEKIDHSFDYSKYVQKLIDGANGSGEVIPGDDLGRLHIGTNFNDFFDVKGGADQIVGELGDDVAYSSNGDDSIYGGSYHSKLGEAGLDTVIYSGKRSEYTIIPLNVGTDQEKVNVVDTKARDTSFGWSGSGDDLYSIERFVFTDGVYIMDSNGNLVKEETVYTEFTITINAKLTDTDGSEALADTITLSGIPDGVTVLVDGQEYLPSNGVYTLPIVVVGDSGNVNVELRVPSDYVGSLDFPITVTATSNEVVNGAIVDSADGTSSIPVSIRGYEVTTGESGSDSIETSAENDIVIGDTSGFQVVPGQDYNIAFIFDTSGSMAGDITKAKPELQEAFNKLVDSASGDNAGTVNILLTEFATKASHVISIDLSSNNPKGQFEAALTKIIDNDTGLTNYESGFDSAIDWFAMLPKNGATNHSFFITDGMPNRASSDDLGDDEFDQFWMYADKSTGEVLSLQDVLGDNFSLSQLWNSGPISLNGVVVVEYHHGHADVYSPYLDQSGQRVLLGTLESDKHGKLKYKDYYDADESQLVQAVHMFNVLAGLSAVQAIGIGDDVNAEILKVFDTDKVVDHNIKVDELAEAIAGELIETLPGADTISTLSGDDILFGDEPVLFAADGMTKLTLQEYVAEKLNMGVANIDAKTIHDYITSHIREFDSSSSRDADDHLFGGEGNDILFGQGGNDRLDGGVGEDNLYGGAGNDTLTGGNDNDILIGGLGDDILTGGEGMDIFKFIDDGTGPRDGERDTITDFTAGQDKIDLSDLLHTDLDDSIDSLLERNEIGLAINGGHLELTISDGSSNQTVVIENGVSQYQSYITEGSITNMNAILNDLLKIHDN
ncbi:VCBS domain-containing protein [Vibrio sp. 05-20-BW147]|uniref:VCBS domain-containing protein n=1 Tax=Vibrio sp. 05-20-BW147 TaxID=2575834 RepID=UPI0034E85D01